MKAIIHNLPPISELFSGRVNQINTYISKLKLADLSPEDKFIETLNQIKKSFSLNEVKIGQPECGTPDAKQRSYPTTQKAFEAQLQGVQRNYVEIPVTFDVEGSIELFNYRPLNYGYSDPTIFIPSMNRIEITVQANDKPSAISDANRKLELTKSYTSSNNEALRNWLSAIEGTIKGLMFKRKELLEKFQ